MSGKVHIVVFSDLWKFLLSYRPQVRKSDKSQGRPLAGEPVARASRNHRPILARLADRYNLMLCRSDSQPRRVLAGLSIGGRCREQQPGVRRS